LAFYLPPGGVELYENMGVLGNLLIEVVVGQDDDALVKFSCEDGAECERK